MTAWKKPRRRRHNKEHLTAQQRRSLRRTLPPLNPLERYPIQPDALCYLDLSKKTFYERVRAGLIATIADGGRTFVSGAELVRYSSAP